jgi:hypothetical protein
VAVVPCHLLVSYDDNEAPWTWPDLESALEDDALLYGEWLPCLTHFTVGSQHLPPLHLPVLQVAMMLPEELRMLPARRSFSWPWADSGRFVKFTREDDIVSIEGPFLRPEAVALRDLLSETARVEGEGRSNLSTRFERLHDHPEVGAWLRGARYVIPKERPYPDSD